jgi:ABC-type multidrug transport system ATPase subunit
MKSYLEVKNLCYSHYKQPLCLKDVSFTLQKNETLVVLGHDEMGKTTLLNTVSGFDSRYFGSVTLEGVEVKNIPDEDKGFSIVYEEPILINGTIEKNLDFVCKTLGIKKEKEEKQEILSKFKISADLKARVKKLSYVEKVKLNLARLYIKQPRLVFIDDIFKNLSAEESVEILELAQQVTKNSTNIFVFSKDAVMKNREILNNFKSNKVLYINNSKGLLYKNFSEFEKSCVDLNAVKFFDYYKFVSGACYVEDESYFFVDSTGVHFKFDKEFNKKFNNVQLDVIEGEDTVFVFKKDLNLELYRNNDVNSYFKDGLIMMFLRLDGSRII